MVDDLSSGSRSHLQQHLDAGAVDFRQQDLLQGDACRSAVAGVQTVFHLAAIHGGRGYVDTHQALCAQNLAMDGLRSTIDWYFETHDRAQVARTLGHRLTER